MARVSRGASSRRRARATLLAGLVGGLFGTTLRISRARTRRKQTASTRAFSRASDGMWPPVPKAPIHAVKIEADRATAPLEGGAEQTPA